MILKSKPKSVCIEVMFHFYHSLKLTLQTLFLQHPPVRLSPLECDLWEPAHCHALVVEVVLADVHDGDLLRDVFDGGGVGEGRAHQLWNPLHGVGLEFRS